MEDTPSVIVNIFEAMERFFVKAEGKPIQQVCTELSATLQKLKENQVIRDSDIWDPLEDNLFKFIVEPGRWYGRTMIPDEFHFMVKWDGNRMNPTNLKVSYTGKFREFMNGTHDLNDWRTS